MAAINTFKKIVNNIAGLYSKLIVKLGRISHAKDYKSINIKKAGEKEWKKRWSQIQSRPNINCYRKYADIADNPLNIIPVDTMNTVIQPILNPNIFRPYYLDKNMFERIYGSNNTPVVILRRIEGEYQDSDYKSYGTSKPQIVIPNDVDELIAKPSRDSYGGRNILLFKRNDKGTVVWNEDESKQLEIDLLNELLGDNWVLQKKMKQNPFTAQFNETSVNTFRVHIYRSPLTGKTDIAGMCMRVGAKGNWFDNIHNGGFCVKVDLETGKLGHLVCDGNGNHTDNTNGIDFKHNEFYVPNFEKLKEFAIEMGNKVNHHHSLAADVMMDENGDFKLIEINIGTFESNMYMATGASPFGKYTDEIIEYCKPRKKKVKFVYVIPW